MDVFNVRDFGATGDGFTDDTEAIRAAIREAEGGGEVFFPAGKYKTRPLTIPSYITLRGEASWGYSAWGWPNNHIEDRDPVDADYNGSTVLFPIPTEGECLLDMRGCRGTRIVGLALDGLMWGKHFNGVMAAGDGTPQNLVFDGVRVSHFTGYGLDLSHVNGFAVRKSLIIKNVDHEIWASYARSGIVIDNQLAYGSGGGFVGEGRDYGGFVITANRIEGGTPGGVWLEGADSVSVNGNSFDFNKGPGITFIDCDSCTAVGNMTRGCGSRKRDINDCHIRVEDSRGIAVTGNTAWSWPRLMKRMTVGIAAYGYVLSNLTDCVIRDNSLFDTCDGELIKGENGHINTLIENNQGIVYVWPEEEQ